MAYPSGLKRVWLHSIYQRSRLSGRSLYDEIFAAVIDSQQAALTGVIPQSVSANGVAITNFSPERGGISPADSAGVADEMLTIWAWANAGLIAAGNATPTSAEIYAQMLDHEALQSVRAFFADFSQYASYPR